jgi:hypothetical protein
MSTTEVSPLKIDKSVERGKEYQETLTVRNIGDERTSYAARPDAAYRAWVDPDPELFAINAHESRNILLKLAVPNDAKRGRHEFNVTVANDDNPDDKTEIDVALRVRIPPLWWILIVTLLLVLVLIIIALLGAPGPGGGSTPTPAATIPTPAATGLLWLWGQVVLA